ncbi:type III secretion system (T3SS) inner membrane Yop/YscD-like protein [Murinocardiopsis flavida]|uniref:Type III secretion system (T3SS) inner membrane Yop/YscD-like protein n=1 Tax=Murinocardiopsis flavida TaxID=645275 RepID=A0A2P8DQ32_9ACTN|nr:type III secretion system (T3SS) inner membrane Yop/YscD-like protein [Murinocardiopsis flavida]
MGVLQRFERRLEGMIEGTFARAFKSELQPVEVASAVQREMDERAAIVAQGRTLVPNDFVVELSSSDKERLEVLGESLGQELSKLAREYATEQGYSFVGPVRVRFDASDDLQTGRFRIRSGVIRGSTVESGEIRQPVVDQHREAPPAQGHPRLLLSPGNAREGDPASQGMQQSYELNAQVTLLGRGTDCDLRLVDNGVSRHHAEIRVEDVDAVLVDLGSTNGTFVNGQQVKRARLVDGTRISLGRTIMTFRRD